VRIEDLAEDPFVLYDLPHSREYFTELFAAAGLAMRPAYRSTTFETVRALVAAGQGYSILNQRPVSDTTYDGGRAVPLPLLDPLPPLPVVLARPRGVRPTRRAQAFTELARRLLGTASSASHLPVSEKLGH
jgi:DNA-binding transcriptional LysR family regulator